MVDSIPSNGDDVALDLLKTEYHLLVHKEKKFEKGKWGPWKYFAQYLHRSLSGVCVPIEGRTINKLMDELNGFSGSFSPDEVSLLNIISDPRSFALDGIQYIGFNVDEVAQIYAGLYFKIKHPQKKFP